jgi:hypothetical protein
MEINDIKYGLETQFHMLRHVEFISKQFMNELQSAGYSCSQIEKELAEPGSRFSRSFAENIPQLLEKIFKYGFVERKGSNGNLILNGFAPKIDFLAGIGTKSVISINDLSYQQQQKIVIKNNRGVDLLHLELDTLPSTLEYTVILKPVEDGYIFITAFPGDPAMPLPNPAMSQDLFDECKLYWEGHVFLS